MLTREELHASLTQVLGEQVEPHDNLIELGMDSIRLMSLTGRLRKRGVEVGFAELAERPTLAEWWDLLTERGAIAPAPSGPPAGRDAAEPATASEPAASAEAGTSGASADPAGEPESSGEPGGPFPLALMQHAYWIGRDSEQSLGSVAAHLYVELDGRDIDPGRLEPAVRALVERHPMLRVAVSDDGTQRILSERPGPAIVVNDLRNAADPEAELERLRREMSTQRLPIETGRVFDLRLSLLPSGAARLHLDVDMVAADAMSYRTLLADLAALYEGRTLPPLRYDYARYLAADPRAAARERDRAWWAERLGELPGAPELPVVPRPGHQVVRKHHWLSAEDKGRLIARAHREGVTPAMVLATIFAEVIGAWSATPRFLLNLPLFHREPVHPDVDALVGDFTGSIMLEIDLTRELSFVERARAVQARLHTAGTHSDYSGLEVLRDLSRARGEQVLAPIVYTSALNLGELFGDRVRADFGEPVWIISQGPQVLLDAQVTEVSGGLLLNWDVRDPAFPEGVADAMFAAYTEAITRLGAPGADWTEPLRVQAPSEQVRVRHRLNAHPAPPARTLIEGFFDHARRRPDAPALHWGEDGTLTYGELADRALRTAGHLVAQGVRPGDRVSIELPKGPDQAIAALGVLAAGAAYVPIGTEQPPARREKIVKTAGVAASLTPQTLATALTGTSPAPAGPVPVEPEQVAYVLFTSGSTGEPKGVEVSHRAAMNTIGDLVERFALGPSDISLGVSALDFDLSVFDLFALWTAGGAVVLPAEDERKDAARWAELAGRWSVTVLNCVPSVLEMLLRAGGDVRSLRLVLLGGDWVGTHLPALLAERAPGCRFVALGGTTETAIHSTVLEVVTGQVPADWHAVPYGVPLRGVSCRVVDDLGRDRPDWVPGELWIGGEGVAEGYCGDPERTADRFVMYEGVRWYRTGDLARYWPDGTLEFLGRRDHQVKVRGFRIELGEIEAALESHPAVRRAVGLVTGSRLAAAIVPATGEVQADELLVHAQELLPPHMVPELLVPVDELPLTANGKVDRKALTALVSAETGEGTTAYVAPRTALEKVLARTIGEVLGAERVGADDDFFALGGDSVLATGVIARLREALDTTALPVRVVFNQRTVSRIAHRFTELEDTPGRLETIAEIWLTVTAMSEDEVEAHLSA
ncbi:mycobactin phenyloxazoline synthetase [Thermomonospora echinospora]|uniref:Phenyloxazoline synthase MbtB n=1 Tax=Thermomonospora echinospora TaxID=1992 RepID=A0A1H6CLA1_9ACTN|nr:non-ribosomal peptide synthetase [Thermomonospora echinospora]SEG73754.1 mycobactin phenyloxazoline synthetase [Thermomonospora echinospora]